VLGNYLASLGLLRLLARKWPSVRIAWRDGVLQIVGGPGSLDELLDELMNIADKRTWTSYEREWKTAQDESRKPAKAKGKKRDSGQPFALWEGVKASEEILELFRAHVVPLVPRWGRREEFNPLLGWGGKAGRREFSEGWKKAVEALEPVFSRKPHKKKEDELNGKAGEQVDKEKADEERARKREELKAYLLGHPVTWMIEGLNAASWFSSANKLYNSGQRPFREEPLSPWAMALACEGLPFFAGAASRRLGARARAQGAFPFICEPAAPTAPGEADRDRGEVWAPLWERPMTLPEVRALFQRGRAEVRGRGANTPAAFAAAIVQRGVDAGISSFVRFGLGRTTSVKTFEPRCEGFIPVRRENAQEAVSPARSDAVERVLALVEKLPKDRKEKTRWRFLGLRGPVEAALVRLVQTSDEPEAVRALLDATASALDKVDRNRSFREKRISWEPLPLDYLPALFADEEPGVEARLALALVSSFPGSRPFTLYRFGVEWQSNGFQHPTQPPCRWVWGPGELARVLVNVLRRRTLDWEDDRKRNQRESEEPVRDLFPACCSDVSRWLEGDVDERLMERWLSRLALFDWRTVPRLLLAKLRAGGQAADRVPADGSLCLFGLLQPLFDLRPLQLAGRDDDLLDRETGARTPAAARRLIALIQAGQLDAAVDLAASRYAMAGTPLAKFDVTWFVGDPDRLLASLLFTVSARERAALVQRWLRPQRKKGEVTYA
jgi:CRISPR-associated protein Csx17